MVNSYQKDRREILKLDVIWLDRKGGSSKYGRGYGKDTKPWNCVSVSGSRRQLGMAALQLTWWEHGEINRSRGSDHRNLLNDPCFSPRT